MKRVAHGVLLMCLLVAMRGGAASAEDLVSGISQDTIQITSNYTGTDIVVFGAIERPQGVQGRNIVVVVRGPDQDMTVRRRNRIAGIWINSDAARFEGMPAY
ncbi:MAG: TIGR02186 family protein, partial [Rhizomicrobium sp.]